MRYHVVFAISNRADVNVHDALKYLVFAESAICVNIILVGVHHPNAKSLLAVEDVFVS